MSGGAPRREKENQYGGRDLGLLPRSDPDMFLLTAGARAGREATNTFGRCRLRTIRALP
jgi:hypothetical protein